MYYVTFRFKGWDSTGSNSGWCGVEFYSSSSPNCSGQTLGASLGASAVSSGAWTMAYTAGGPAPVEAVKMSFYCKSTVGHGFYDQLYLGGSSVTAF
jgi:hypothetical protein